MKSFHPSEIHRKKLKKNLAVMGIVLGLVALIFAVSIIKMAGG